MFAAPSEELESLFMPSRHDECKDYLALTSDLGDFERRVRHLDKGDYPFSLHSRAIPGDNKL